MQNCEGSERRFLFENNKQPSSSCNFLSKVVVPTMPGRVLFSPFSYTPEVALMQPVNVALKQHLRFQAYVESPYILKEFKRLILVEKNPKQPPWDGFKTNRKWRDKLPTSTADSADRGKAVFFAWPSSRPPTRCRRPLQLLLFFPRSSV